MALYWWYSQLPDVKWIIQINGQWQEGALQPGKVHTINTEDAENAGLVLSNSTGYAYSPIPLPSGYSGIFYAVLMPVSGEAPAINVEELPTPPRV